MPWPCAVSGPGLRKVAGLQAKTVDVPGYPPFSYLVSGNGEPLVLVDGLTADKDTRGAVARHLMHKYTVIAPDLPGFGDTMRDPHVSYSLDVQVKNLRAFLLSLGLGLGRVHLGGNTMGGGVVALYAAQYPNEVASLRCPRFF